MDYIVLREHFENINGTCVRVIDEIRVERIYPHTAGCACGEATNG